MTDTNNMRPAPGFLAALERELDVDLIEWEPTAPGERIVGEVKTIEYVPVKSGDVMGIVTLETPSKALARVACGAKNLRSQLEAIKLQPGDGLGLKYEGQKQSRSGGNAYNAYRVAHAPVGERKPGQWFKVPDRVEDDDLHPAAANDAWQQGSQSEAAPY